MAVVQDISTRIIQKHDTTEQWEQSNTFIPRKGEIIAYDAEYGDDGTQLQPPRLKIGDGILSLSSYSINVDPEGRGIIPVAFSGSFGASGQVLTSRGANTTPEWTTPVIKSATLTGTILYLTL